MLICERSPFSMFLIVPGLRSCVEFWVRVSLARRGPPGTLVPVVVMVSAWFVNYVPFYCVCKDTRLCINFPLKVISFSLREVV